MIEPVSITEELRARIEELTRERDAANAKHETLSALVEGYRRERDDLRAEITKAQESFDDDGPSGWMPGETAIDALIRTRDEARAEVESLNRDVECLQLGLTVTNHAYRSGYKAGSRDAYRRGAEAMREACARTVEDADDGAPLQMLADDEIRALPIPDDKP
jgi:chromosome segregation ATPase